jgi:hypothetical protein
MARGPALANEAAIWISEVANRVPRLLLPGVAGAG